MPNECITCGSKSSKNIYTYDRWNKEIDYCSKCHLGYIRGSKKELLKHFKDYYSGKYWFSEEKRVVTEKPSFTRQVSNRVVRVLRKLKVPPLMVISRYKEVVDTEMLLIFSKLGVMT